MTFELHTTRRIQFAETDMAGIVHFSNYFRYMEEAEHQFFRSLGFSGHTRIDGQTVGWPRVRVECSYKAPLSFDEEVKIHLLVRKKTKKTLTYDIDFFNAEGAPVARGRVTAICVAIDPVTKKLSAISIPACIAAKIEQAPEERLRP
jgi:YbgC/YbaW family acyl-CoA thioester hydrolase